MYLMPCGTGISLSTPIRSLDRLICSVGAVPSVLLVPPPGGLGAVSNKDINGTGDHFWFDWGLLRGLSDFS